MALWDVGVGALIGLQEGHRGRRVGKRPAGHSYGGTLLVPVRGRERNAPEAPVGRMEVQGKGVAVT